MGQETNYAYAAVDISPRWGISEVIRKILGSFFPCVPSNRQHYRFRSQKPKTLLPTRPRQLYLRDCTLSKHAKRQKPEFRKTEGKRYTATDQMTCKNS